MISSGRGEVFGDVFWVLSVARGAPDSESAWRTIVSWKLT